MIIHAINDNPWNDNVHLNGVKYINTHINRAGVERLLNIMNDITGLKQDCCNSIANAPGLLQSCTKPSINASVNWWSLVQPHATRVASNKYRIFAPCQLDFLERESINIGSHYEYIIAYVKIQKNEDILSIMSNLQTNCCLKIDFQKVDQHAGGKWLIHDTKRRKDNHKMDLKMFTKRRPCHYDTNKFTGTLILSLTHLSHNSCNSLQCPGVSGVS